MKIIGIDYSLTSPAITLYNGNDKWNYSSGSCTHFCLASNERQRSKWAEIRSVKTDIYPVWETDLQRYHGLANWVINCCITAISPERPKAYIEDYAYAAYSTYGIEEYLKNKDAGAIAAKKMREKDNQFNRYGLSKKREDDQHRIKHESHSS